MNQLTIYKNPRCLVLMALAVVAALLITADTEAMGVYVIVKACAIVICAAIYLLARHWHRQGKLTEIDNLKAC